MTVLATGPMPATRIAEVAHLPVPTHGFHREPRCRVCRNDVLVRKVNDLLTSGATYNGVLRALTEDNAKLDRQQQVTIDSIRNHTNRHFPVQNAARATYRAILEKRAQENGVDFINGVATAITPMAVFETIMARGYETIIDPNTKIDVNTAMVAACRLHAMTEERASETSIVEMRVKIGRVIDAVKSTVPESMWPDILRKLEGGASEPFSDDADDFDPEDDVYDHEEPDD